MEDRGSRTARRASPSSILVFPPSLRASVVNSVRGVKSSQPDPRVVLVRRADVAKPIQRGGEEFEELLQADEVLDDADRVELQLVHALRELRPEPAFVVEDAERQRGL